MQQRRMAFALASALCVVSACSASDGDDEDDDGPSTPAATGGSPAAGGSGGHGLLGSGGMAGSGGRAGNGGAPAGSGGANAGGSGGAGTAGNASNSGDAGIDDSPLDYELDCGASGVALESHGPPSNRVNYVIVGDAYTQAELDTTYMQHLDTMLSMRFAELEPYVRYRKFVNICALKVPSAQSGVGTQAGDTAFDGYGNDESRLGYVNDDKVYAKIEELLPAEIEVDWTAVVLNGDRWWNSGGRLMVWSGGHPSAALAAMHEGGHAFQRLADEYGGDCDFSGNEDDLRINVTMDAVDTAGKWKHWFDFDQTPGTGMQGTFEGAQYCDRGAWRPSQESVMNQLQRSSWFNSISLEQAVRIIYESVRPFDLEYSTDTSETKPGVLQARVVDPEVIAVDWSIDGAVVKQDGGQTFDVAAQGLSAGSHTVAARAHDDTEWVRGDREELEQTLEWTIAVP